MNKNENYIKFYYDREGNPSAEINIGGKKELCKEEKELRKLIEICQKYGQDKAVIKKHVTKIYKELKEYLKEQKRKKRLKIYGKIKEKMKIVTNAPLYAKITAGAITVGLIAIPFLHSEENDTSNRIIAIEEEPDNELPKPPLIVPRLEEEPQEQKTNIDFQQILDENSFHYYYEQENSYNNQTVINAKRYEQIFEKYANMYGVDKDLLIAIAAQESSGNHYENVLRTNAAAEGIMQIQKTVHINTTIYAYNFETKQTEGFEITEENLKDLDTNIKIGAMFLRECLEAENYNIPLAVQAYNFGQGNINKVLNNCYENSEEIRNNPLNNIWLDHRAFLNIGDAQYIEHVFRYLPPNKTINVRRRDNTIVSIPIQNDYLNEKEKVPTL